MRIRSWAGGLALFGLFYSAIIIAMSAWEWPSLANPNINITFEDRLPAREQDSVFLIQKSKLIDVSAQAPSYKLVPEGYSQQETVPVEFLDTAIMVNGHVIVFESGVSTPYMEEIATLYAEILVEHQIHETANAIVRLFITLFIPIVTLSLFGWAGSSLWRAIQKLD